MWVWYCRPPIGAHFHPNPQPRPVPQQLGEKALFARSVAALRRPPLGGRTRLVTIIIIITTIIIKYISKTSTTQKQLTVQRLLQQSQLHRRAIRGETNSV